MSAVVYRFSYMDVSRSVHSGAAEMSLRANVYAPLRFPSTGWSLLYPHFPSSSALAEGTRLLITGGIIEAYRRVFIWLVKSVVDRFCITATFDEKDPMYSTSFQSFSRRTLIINRLAVVLAFAPTYMAYVAQLAQRMIQTY